ncbi:DNA mismatch repair protein MSH2 [Clonorchis sinensis]|uniref:DNA mismatch repair protein MSH2 n=1 Tax=Clonorchis sinensis TaxID=79923 RepID=G7YUM4_CLOSI|nr:DNA mismatch repair protein MSH2 [Clonorchis sinensis]
MDPTVTEHLNLIFQRTGFLATEVEKSNFALQDVTQDLNYLLRRPRGIQTTGISQDNKAFEHKQGLACLGAIIKYLDLKSDDSNAGVFSLEPFSLDNFVRLDSAATRALHLLPGPDDKNRYQSVYGVLNNCRTQQGQRLLAQWLRQPLTDINKINERLDMVEALVEETGVRQSLHDDFLRRMPDFQRIGRKLQRKQGCGLQDVYRIYQAVARLQNAISLLRQCGGQTSLAVQKCLIEPLQVAAENFSKFQEMVQSTIDLEMIQRRNEYIIRSDFDDELGELKSKLDKLEESIEDEFRRSARKLNLEPGKSVKLDSNEQLGYFMRVTLKEEKTLRDFKSFEVLDAQKGGVRFRNSSMSQLNTSHLEMKQEYAAAQQTIVDEVLRITAGYLEPIHELNACTALLDVIVSLAVTACSATGGQYVRPRLLPRESGRMVFKEMRHPCLELQDTASVIPNDVHLERGKQIFLVITGPNMGGKSTYIRSVGVITAMAQIGSFVPCSFAELFPVDAVMARVGAADCQIRGVSTFMAEMLETSSVLRAATPNSLVIIDELGRGTSTFDGFGLAWAVASHLAGPQLGCFSLFATHFHELTTLARHMPGRVANLRVTAHVSPESSADSINGSSVVMLYKVEPGICTRSYGLDVAKLVGLPDKVLTEAEHKAARDEQLESLWLTLDGKYRMDSDGDPACKRIRLDSDVSEVHASAAVVIADQLRGQLLRILDDAIGSEQNTTPDGVNKFGAHLAHITKALLNNSDSNLPQELLLLAK